MVIHILGAKLQIFLHISKFFCNFAANFMNYGYFGNCTFIQRGGIAA